jgi:hypothetical protein
MPIYHTRAYTLVEFASKRAYMCPTRIAVVIYITKRETETLLIIGM